MRGPDRWVLGHGRPSRGATGGGRAMSPSRRQQAAQRRAQAALRALREDRAAVSDVLGALMLVGITVIAAVGLGILLLSFDGPENQLHADLELRTDPGTGGWASGDESVQVVHLGGEDVPADGVMVRFSVGSSDYCFGDEAGCSALSSAWGDGALSIGETWEAPTVPPLNLAADTGVDVTVVLTGVLSQVLASGLVSGAEDPSSVSCLIDTSAPTGSFSHADLKTSDRTAAFQVVLVATDLCGEVDETVLPTLHYRVTPALSGVPSTYADAGSNLGTMPFLAGTGFVLSIPAPSGTFGWASAYGRTVEWYASGLTDEAVPTPNSGDTATDSELIQVIGASAAAPDSITLTAGHFTAAGPQANLNTNNGVNALLQEACMITQPALNIQSLCGTTTTGFGTYSNQGNILFSDNSRSTHSQTGSYVEAYDFDLPATSSDISSLSIIWEGSRGGGSGSNPTLAIEANFGPDYSSTSTGWSLVSTITPGASEGTSTMPWLLAGPWTADQFSNLHVRARISNAATKTIDTDAFYIIVTYPSSVTVRDLDAQFNWDLGSYASGSAIRELQLEYLVATGETYTVEVYNGSTWDTCTGSLTATTLTAYTCSLTEAQVTQGPLARIRGSASNDSTAPSSLALDYAHVLVVQ